MNPKDTFISAYQKYIHRTGSDSLLDRLLATDFFEAPASTKFHNSFAGGLVLHSLNVFQRMCRNCMNELGTDTLFPPKQVESVAIVSLLHDICKTQSYKMEFKDQKVYSDHGTKFDKRGAYDLESVPFYTVDEKFPFGHGEKSVFLINEHMDLTRDEALAIRFHMGDFTDRNTSKVYTICPLALQLHIADLQATYLDELASMEGQQWGAGIAVCLAATRACTILTMMISMYSAGQTPRRMTARSPA